MDFSKALNMCKAGKSIRRTGWNGKDQYVYYVKAGKYSPASKIAQVAFRGQDVPYRDYLAMKTVQNDVVPWIASQSDLLCDDWEEYFNEYQNKLKQIKTQIDKIDRQINEMVYKLYNLTTEEIVVLYD